MLYICFDTLFGCCDMKPLMCVLFVLFSTAFQSAGNEHLSPPELDSLQILAADTTTNYSLRIEALLQLLWNARSNEAYLALVYGKQAIQIAAGSGLELSHGKALIQTGIIYWRLGALSSALDHFLQASRIYETYKDAVGMARSYTNIGIIYKEQARYEQALGFLFNALKIYEEMGIKNGVARALNNIGVVYYNQERYELARQYHKESLSIKEAENDEQGIAFSLYNLGLVSQQLKEFDLALAYFNDSYQIRERYLDLREMAGSLSAIGSLYMETDELLKARDYLSRAYKLYKEVEDQMGIAQTYHEMGKVLFTLNNTDLAETHLLKSLNLAIELRIPRLQLKNYELLTEVCASSGRFRDAYAYQKKSRLLRDSIYDEASRQRMLEMKEIYDRDRQEQEIALLRKKNIIGELSLEKQKVLRNFLFLVVILFVFFLFLIYNRYLFARKTNRMLESQKREISEKNERLAELNQILIREKTKVEELNTRLQLANKRLRDSEQHLLEHNATKDKFFSIISHDLKNPFAAIASFANLLKRDMDILSKKELQSLAGELDQAVWKINTLLENLLQWSRSQTGKLSFHPEVLDMYLIGQENMQLFESRAKEKGIALFNETDPGARAYADPNMIHTVMRNLLSNAIKYTDQGGKVSVRSEIKENKCWIHISDNGTGISDKDQKRIFAADTLFSNRGTREEKGSGLGLLLCKEFVEQNKGQITFSSTEGAGSVFSFSLPLSDPGQEV